MIGVHRMSPKKKLIIVIGVFVILSIIAIVFALINQQSPQTISKTDTATNQNQYTDPVSGEVVSNPSGKAPEDASGYNGVTFLGFARLIDYGISSDQLTIIKGYLENYKDIATGNKITQISLDATSLKQSVNADSGTKIVTVRIVVNKSTEQTLELTYQGIEDMAVTVYDKDRVQVYSSQAD